MAEVVGAGSADASRRIADVLVAGGVVVVPTDTVYGVAACPDDPAAVRRLFALKGREDDAPIAVLCAGPAQALSLAGPLGPAAAQLAAEHWPGPLTMVLPRRADLDFELGEPTTTIGVRCPDHDLIRTVAAAIGPIATTSANRHGEPTPATAGEAEAALAGPVDLVVDGGELAGRASTVVDLTGPDRRILRRGPIDLDG